MRGHLAPLERKEIFLVVGALPRKPAGGLQCPLDGGGLDACSTNCIPTLRLWPSPLTPRLIFHNSQPTAIHCKNLNALCI